MEWIIILAVIIIVLNHPIVKGCFGELAVNMMLKFLDKEIYTLHKDLYIPKEDGTTSQVDHVIVSKYGVFIIETKNYKGWIFGSEKAKQWTQVIYRRKEKFLNPIIQNKGHIKHLAAYLDVKKEKFISIISFSLRSTLKKIDTTTPVVYSVRLVGRIKTYHEQLLSDDEVVEVNQALSNIGKTSIKGKREHVHNVKATVEKAKNTCPRCGNDLMERTGKNGKFIGCSSYPKCRYTASVN